MVDKADSVMERKVVTEEPIVRVVPADGGPEVRKFANPVIQRAVDAAWESGKLSGIIPAGNRFAMIGHYNSDGTAAVAAVVKLGNELSISAQATHQPGGKWEGQASALWSPF